VEQPTDTAWVAAYNGMRTLVISELGAETAAFLAQAELDPDRVRIRWTVPTNAPSVPFANLHGEARSIAEAAAKVRLDRLRTWAVDAATSPDVSRAQAGKSLSDALRRAGPSTLFLVDNTPVLASQGDPSLVTVAERVTSDRRHWVTPINLFLAPNKRWVLGVLAVGAAAFLGCLGFAVAGYLPPRVDGGVVERARTGVSTGTDRSNEAAASLATARDEETALRGRIDELISATAGRRFACRAPSLPPVVSGSVLAIPPDLTSTSKIDFLKGCWINNTGLTLDSKDEPAITIVYCFDENGGASRLINIVGKATQCSGHAVAHIESNGAVMIKDTDVAPCSDGDRISMVSFVCRRDAAGTTDCVGTREDKRTFSVTITRK